MPSPLSAWPARNIHCRHFPNNGPRKTGPRRHMLRRPRTVS